MVEVENTIPWYQGVAEFDPELIGHVQNKGWDKLSAPQATAQAVKAWKAAEKLIGVPADQVLRLPQDPKDEAAVKAFWGKLGAPADAKDYDFSTVKLDGKDLPDTFKEALRATASNLHLPKDTAAAVADAFAKYLDTTKKAEGVEHAAAVDAERAKLATNWGANKDANMVVAQNAAKALGVTAEEISALEKVVGYSRTMDLFRNVGSKIGEDKFITDAGQGNKNGVMTREQATARVAELTNDTAWVARYNNGGAPEIREMTNLLKIQIGGDDTAQSQFNSGGRF